MVNSKRYEDELGNRVILERDGKDFLIRITFDEENIGNEAYEEHFVTRKDFEKMKELDAQGGLSE